MGEHLPYKQGVTGSSPVLPTNIILSRTYSIQDFLYQKSNKYAKITRKYNVFGLFYAIFIHFLLFLIFIHFGLLDTKEPFVLKK